MEQLVILRDSLLGLNEEEEERRKEVAEGSKGMIQEAEIISDSRPSSPPPLKPQQPLPTPSVIKPPTPATVEQDNKGWGSAWGKNRRIQAAGVSLLNKPSYNSPPSLRPAEQVVTPSQIHEPPVRPSSHKDEKPSREVDEGGLVSSIVSKRAGKERAPKVDRSPEERQAIVKDALRFAAEPDELDEGEEEKSGKSNWWKRRFQALWLPTLVYADGSLGFVQIDVSLTEGRKDVRVIAFGEPIVLFT